MFFDVLDNIIDKSNNTYHATIAVKSNSYAKYNIDSNVKGPKFKLGDHVKWRV